VINDLELRIALNRRLNMPLSDVEWDFLETQGWIRDIRCGRLLLDAAAEKIQQMRRAFGNAPPQIREKNGLPPDQRMEALAVIIGQEIINATEGFRQRHLGGRFLRESEVEGWLKSHSVPEPIWVGEFLVDALQNDPKPTAFRGISGVLEIYSPGTGKPICFSPGGVLDELRAFAQVRGGLFHLSQSEAIRTILTGLPPRIKAIRISPRFAAIPACSRFRIEVDPAVTPAELARAYKDARKQYLKGRVRRLSTKHLQLAAFMASRPAGEKGKDAMAAWNRKFKRWKYTHVSNFLRDAAVARRRLLAPGGLDYTSEGRKQ
jgi:hypothetical protein